MKEEILSIASDLREGSMTISEAKEQLLRLFGVSGQSEQLPTREENDKKWEKLRNSGLDTKLTIDNLD